MKNTILLLLLFLSPIIQCMELRKRHKQVQQSNNGTLSIICNTKDDFERLRLVRDFHAQLCVKPLMLPEIELKIDEYKSLQEKSKQILEKLKIQQKILEGRNIEEKRKIYANFFGHSFVGACYVYYGISILTIKNFRPEIQIYANVIGGILVMVGSVSLYYLPSIFKDYSKLLKRSGKLNKLKEKIDTNKKINVQLGTIIVYLRNQRYLKKQELDKK